MKCMTDHLVADHNGIQTPWPLVIWISVYFLWNTDLLSYVMIRSCKKFFTRYRQFWNIVETLALIASIVTTIFSIYHSHSYPFPSIFIGATKCLQWLRFFSFLKEINMQLSTFVLSTSKVSYTIEANVSDSLN